LERTAAEQKIEIEALKRKYRNQCEALDRQRQLTDVQLKSAAISHQSQIAIAIEKKGQAYEYKMRNLIALFIRSFPGLSEISGPLNEVTFGEAITRLKGMLEQFKARENTIRQLIKADDYESVDDALARFLISNHPKLRL
jgi:hypothetical protein